MTDFLTQGRVRLIGLVVSFGIFIVGFAFLVSEIQKTHWNKKIKELTEEKDELSQRAEKIQKLLSEKENALDTANRSNFQADLVSAQAALKEVNDKLSVAARERANLENANAVLDSRLKSTTTEMTRALDELKKVRETLNGIEGQYKIKINQLNDLAKNKESQLQKFQDGIKGKEGALSDIQKRQKGYSQSLQQTQGQIDELQKTVAALNKALSDKDRAISARQAELDRYKKEGANEVRGVSDARSKLAMLEQDKSELEKQISESSAKLFDQQEQLEDLEKKVSDLSDTLSQRELTLMQKEGELKKSAKDIKYLRDEIASLSSDARYSSKTPALLSESQKVLQSRVRQLENEKNDLEAKLERAQRVRATGKADSSDDIFSNRNFRILTETLVKKEEQIKQMEAEIESLRSEGRAQEGGAGMNEKRLAELEILVNTLTKQLGEYAGMIEKRDEELKISNDKVDLLMQEIEAQKIASIALQKDLSQARTRQEKTFQTLTQAMSMNADGAITSKAFVPEQETPKAENASDVRKRVDDLKKQVEVLLEK